jgi:FAD/FMN-containing dehydrogenase
MGSSTAWAETGLTAGEYSVEAGAHGLVTGFGDTASVGIGGLTLGGGVGYLVRKYGLTIDDLLGAEVVTADGEQLRVDEGSHPDLFWAIRGEAYPKATWDRLAEVKKRYDPTNLFRLNQNIPPAASKWS